MWMIRAVGLVGVISLLSKLTGFAREMALARAFGAGELMDAYKVAQSLPGLFFVCIGAALATTVVPMYTERLHAGGREDAFAFGRKLGSIALLFAGLLSLSGVIFAPWVVKAVAPALPEETYRLCVPLTRILFPGLLFTAMAFLWSGMLQSHGRFALPAVMGIPANLLLIATVPLIGHGNAGVVLGWLTLAGVALQWLVQIPALRRLGFHFGIQLDWKDPAIQRAGILIGPVVLGTAIIQINALVDRMFASGLPPGSISVMDWATKITGLVITLVITSAATVAFPHFSELAATGQKQKLAEKVGFAIAGLIALTLPMAAALIILRAPIVRFVYLRGAFTEQSAELTSTALLFASLGLVGAGIREIVARAFYAAKNTVTPMVNGLMAITLNLGLLVLLVGHLKLGVAGMLLAGSCALTFSGLRLTWRFSRQMGRVDIRSILDSVWRSALATACMSAVLWRLQPQVERIIPGGAFLSQAIELLMVMAAGGTTYLMALTALRAREARYCWRAARKAAAYFTARPSRRADHSSSS